jgi:hypothetical protein
LNSQHCNNRGSSVFSLQVLAQKRGVEQEIAISEGSQSIIIKDYLSPSKSTTAASPNPRRLPPRLHSPSGRRVSLNRAPSFFVFCLSAVSPDSSGLRPALSARHRPRHPPGTGDLENPDPESSSDLNPRTNTPRRPHVLSRRLDSPEGWRSSRWRRGQRRQQSVLSHIAEWLCARQSPTGRVIYQRKRPQDRL